jgi:hypothetical protein
MASVRKLRERIGKRESLEPRMEAGVFQRDGCMPGEALEEMRLIRCERTVVVHTDKKGTRDPIPDRERSDEPRLSPQGMTNPVREKG